MAWTAPRTWVALETLTAALLNEQVRDNWNAAFPVGSLHWRMQAATSVETTIDGFVLEANGVSVLRATYSALNTKLNGLSYPFGTVDGTHMTLPDLSGRTPYMMAASGHNDVNALGDSDGLTKTSRSPQHNSTSNLTWSGSISPDPHSHSVINPANAQIAAAGADRSVSDLSSTTTGTTSLTVSGSVGGSIGPGGTRPDDTVPFLVVGVLGIKY